MQHTKHALTTLTIDEGLVLKQLEPSDALDIFTTIDTQRAFLGKWLPFVEYTHFIADTQSFVESVVHADEAHFEFVFVIRKNQEFAGLIGFKSTDKLNKRTEIGYWLSESFQKQGIVTRAVERLCAFAFQELGMNRIQVKCAVGNIPSKRVAQRLGFVFEGIERQGEWLTEGFFTDVEVYSKLKSDLLL
jgi:ribosomal-protein-serine acetyltransferase